MAALRFLGAVAITYEVVARSWVVMRLDSPLYLIREWGEYFGIVAK